MNANNPSECQDLGNAGNPTESERSDRRRMRKVLGINAAGIEVILRLRRQMITLQTRVRQLEAELAMWQAGQNTRLVRHRETCSEASWQEVTAPEERS
jgi:DNA-binding PadR family transcriptional regulator